MTPRLRDEMIHIRSRGFLVIDADGASWGGPTRPRRSITASPGARSSPRTARRAPWAFLRRAYQAEPRHEMALRHVAPPQRARRAFSGVIAAVMEIENFDRLYRTIDVGEGGFINLRARDGTVIARFRSWRARGRKFPIRDLRVVEREGA